MFDESYLEFMVRWHSYRRWRRPRRRARQAEYDFYGLMRSVTAGDLFLDLGANIGTVSLVAASYGMKVVAYEPDPVARAVFERRAAGRDGIVIVPKAVGATARVATFYQRPDVADVRRTESSSLVRTQEHQGGTAIEVEVANLIEVVRGLDRPISILKMDIEGAEAECLEALLDAKLHLSIGHILVETHERFSPDLASRIGALRKRVVDEGITNIDMDWV